MVDKEQTFEELREVFKITAINLHSILVRGSGLKTFALVEAHRGQENNYWISCHEDIGDTLRGIPADRNFTDWEPIYVVNLETGEAYTVEIEAVLGEKLESKEQFIK
jgi:hypothetical protein